MKKLLSVTLLGLALVLSYASTTDKEEKKKAEAVKSATTQVKTTPGEIKKAYADNEVAADSKFKGKVIEIQGKVSSVGKDVLDRPYVVLKEGFLGLQCLFGKHDSKALAGLKKGQAVTLKCKCEGKSMGSPVLKSCSVL